MHDGPVVDLFPEGVRRLVPVDVELVEVDRVRGQGVARLVETIAHPERPRRDADEPGLRRLRQRHGHHPRRVAALAVRVHRRDHEEIGRPIRERADRIGTAGEVCELYAVRSWRPTTTSHNRCCRTSRPAEAVQVTVTDPFPSFAETPVGTRADRLRQRRRRRRPPDIEEAHQPTVACTAAHRQEKRQTYKFRKNQRFDPLVQPSYYCKAQRPPPSSASGPSGRPA